MSTEIRIPSLGAGMSEGRLVEWHVQNGASIAQGDVIYSLESEKTVQEIEAPAAGTIELIGQPDETYPVGELIARLATT
jgi:pyruvate/2-oxoglutarate dehydrogenase complex dihydrolipoamide acyltransferase (E2) component